MKICPKCQNKYTDETLIYCLQDGTELAGTSVESSSDPDNSYAEAETVISGKKPEQINFDLSNSDERNFEESQVTRVSTIPQAEPKSSKTLIAILLTALVMLMLFSIAGIGAYLYFNNGRAELAGNSKNNSTNQKEDPTPEEIADSKKQKPKSDKTSETTPEQTIANTPVPTPETNKEETKKQVSDTIYNWKSLAEARNLGAYMNNYASKLHYYNKKSASKSFVQNDKRKAFNKYDSIKATISNINISPGNDGKSAVATFDKEWLFTNEDGSNSGKVRSQLKFRKDGDKWLIISERDLKIYYVNK